MSYHRCTICLVCALQVYRAQAATLALLQQQRDALHATAAATPPVFSILDPPTTSIDDVSAVRRREQWSQSAHSIVATSALDLPPVYVRVCLLLVLIHAEKLMQAEETDSIYAVLKVCPLLQCCTGDLL
jgi:hypothetical protein